MTTPSPRTERESPHPLVDRYQQLQQLKRNVDAELLAVENGLRVAGILSVHGCPRIAPTHTVAEARRAHAAWSRGERADQWVIDGERQYQREKKRDERARNRQQRSVA